MQLDSARPYLELGAQYRCLCFWLLPPEVRGLAPVRSEIIRRTAGRGPVLVMDDDAKAWRLSKKNSRGCAMSPPVTAREPQTDRPPIRLAPQELGRLEATHL